VISVGATNRNDIKSVFSNWANSVDIVAPGENIITITHNNGLAPTTERVDGTSFSCPIVSGTIGLMLSVNPCLTLADVESILYSTAVNIDALNPNHVSGIGAGRLDAAAAVAAANPSAMPVAAFQLIDSCGLDLQFKYGGPLNSCGQNFFWNFNGKTSSDPNPSFAHPGAGTYNLTLVVNNSVGTANASQMITLGDPIGIDAGGDENGVLTACFGQIITINATSSLANPTYTWSPTSGLIGAGTLTPSLTANARRTYTLTAVGAGGCILQDHVEVVPINSVFAGQDVTINKGDSAQLNVTVVGNSGYTYEWSPAAGLSNPFIQNPKASPSSTTTYTAKVITGTGCELEDDVTVTTVVGLEEEFAVMGTVNAAFPNPAANQIFLSANLTTATHLSLKAFDMTGREVATLFEGKVPVGDFQATWQREAAHSSGIYFLVWQTPTVHFVQKLQWR
jgi:PKD repeat protein